MIGETTYALAMSEPDDAVPMPGSQLLHLEGCEIWIGPPTLPNLTVVRKVRATVEDAEGLLLRVREAVSELGRDSARWWITPLSTPATLVGLLTDAGLKFEDEDITAMAATCSAIAGGTSRIEVRRAKTLGTTSCAATSRRSPSELGPPTLPRRPACLKLNERKTGSRLIWR